MSFLFNEPATTRIYTYLHTLSLHAARPVSPGHTPGQVAVLVSTASGAVLLASDAAHFFEQVDRGWRFFAHSDAAQSDRSMRMPRARARAADAPLDRKSTRLNSSH